MSERDDDVLCDGWPVAIAYPVVVYDDRQGWPNAQHLVHRSSACADNSETEAAWRRKDDISPSPGDVHQGIPSLCLFDIGPFRICAVLVGFLHTETEDFQERIVWKCFDGNLSPLSAKLACTTKLNNQAKRRNIHRGLPLTSTIFDREFLLSTRKAPSIVRVRVIRNKRGGVKRNVGEIRALLRE